MRPNLKVSLFGFLVHEIHAVIRHARADGVAFFEIYEKLASIQEKETVHLAKYSSLFLIGVIAINALDDGGVIKVQTAFIDLNVPKIYAIFGCVSVWSAIVLKLFSLLIVVVHISVAEHSYTSRNRFASVRLQHRGFTINDPFSPQRNGHLAKHSMTSKFLVGTPFLVIMLALISPTLGAYFYLLSEVWSTLFQSDGVFMSLSLSIAAFCLLTVPYCYGVLYFTRFPIHKDVDGIRWNFLNRISGKPHPNLTKWLETGSN